MSLTRRAVVQGLGAAAVTNIVSQGPAPKASTGNAAFRMPLETFVQTPELVAALRKGVAAMRARKPSDPLSWFYQAAIHAVSDERLAQALKVDPEVGNVDAKKYWNQCPHMGQNSANFLPWHRAYTYHFERILRAHTGVKDFALPYWDYTNPSNDRKFPQIFGVQHLDGNLKNDDPANINPLWEAERDFYFTSYEHPLTTKLPLLALSDDAVDITLPMSTPVFFGQTEREGLGGGIADADGSTRGLLESYPHDQIHRAVGGIVGSHAGAMAIPPTAAFDPVFWVHHTNVDRLWTRWSCSPGKTWGAMPPSQWFDEQPWFFFDENGMEVNKPRRFYFDHRALGIRFDDDDPSCEPLALPTQVAEGSPAGIQARSATLTSQPVERIDVQIIASAQRRTVVPLSSSVKAALGSPPVRDLAASPQPQGPPGGASVARSGVVLNLEDIEFSTRPQVGFDLHIVPSSRASAGQTLRRSDPSFVGSINLFNHPHAHAHQGGGASGLSQAFDITAALGGGPPADASARAEDLSLVLVPYPLFKVIETGAPFSESQPLSIRGLGIRVDR